MVEPMSFALNTYVRRFNFTTKRHNLMSTCRNDLVFMSHHFLNVKTVHTGLLFNPSDEAANWNCILPRHSPSTGKVTKEVQRRTHVTTSVLPVNATRLAAFTQT